MEASKSKVMQFYTANKKNALAGIGFVVVLLFLIIGAIVIKLNQTTPPSATIAYNSEGFAPPTLKLLVDNQGTDILFINESNEPLDISESSSNPEVFQVGILESKNIIKPKKVHLSKSGIYTFTNNKDTAQTAVVEVITTDQIEQQ